MEQKPKRRGRPSLPPEQKMARMLRVLLTARQNELLQQLRIRLGGSEAEHVRRALDSYLGEYIKRGEIKEER